MIKLNKARLAVLQELGFECTDKGNRFTQMGATIETQTWKCTRGDSTYELIIRYDSDEGTICYLYINNSATPEEFSFLRLVSQLRKYVD